MKRNKKSKWHSHLYDVTDLQVSKAYILIGIIRYAEGKIFCHIGALSNSTKIPIFANTLIPRNNNKIMAK